MAATTTPPLRAAAASRSGQRRRRDEPAAIAASAAAPMNIANRWAVEKASQTPTKYFDGPIVATKTRSEEAASARAKLISARRKASPCATKTSVNAAISTRI